MRAVPIVLAATFGCSDALESSERITVIDANGGTAISADGSFSLIVPPQALARSENITIRAVTEREPIGLVSPLYRIEPSLVFVPPATASFALGDRLPEGRFAVSLWNDGVRDDLAGAIHDHRRRLASAPIARTDLGSVALFDLPYVPCEGRSCGEGCAPCNSEHPDCAPLDHPMFCGPSGECVEDPACAPDTVPGWNDPPGSGRVFVFTTAQVAQRGEFNLDGYCAPLGTCDDDVLSPLAIGNDQIRQFILAGDFLIALEVVGAEEGLATLKIYSVRDADDPFFPANNFQIPSGETVCCQFIIHPQSRDSDGQARTRLPIWIHGDTITSAAPGDLVVPISIGVPPHPELAMTRAFVSLRLPATIGERGSGALGGAVRLRDLSLLCNPYCITLNEYCDSVVGSTMLDLARQLIVRSAADIDVDGDGLESFFDTDGDGRVDLCLDGCIDCPSPAAIGPIDPLRPETCTLHPDFADGLSITFSIELVPAQLVQ